MVDWVRTSVELAAPGDPVRVEAQALWGLGLGWQGRLTDGLAAYDEVLDSLADRRSWKIWVGDLGRL